MKRRPRRSLPAALTALTLLAAAAAVLVVAVQVILGERPWVDVGAVASWLLDTHWRDMPVLLAGSGAAALGLVLLLCAVLPGRPTVLPLRGDVPGTDTGASRGSMRTTLRTAAAAVDGVRSARLRLGRRRATVTVRTDRTNTTGLADTVRAAVERRLDQIAPERRPEQKVRVRARREDS